MLRLSLVLGLLCCGEAGIGEESEKGLQPPIAGQGETVGPIPSPGEGLEGVPGWASKPTVQILFHRPEGAKVYWDVAKAGAFESTGLSLPGRHNFSANALYRVRLTDVRERKGDEFFPTLEIAPFSPRREKYWAVNAVPIQFSSEDLDHASRGEPVTKVVYLPDDEFAELAPPGGVDTLVSFHVATGVDPIIEADRRGTILVVVRLSDVKLAARLVKAVTPIPEPKPATVATPENSLSQGPRNRRGWLRRR
jgi:hypothetical protein